MVLPSHLERFCRTLALKLHLCEASLPFLSTCSLQLFLLSFYGYLRFISFSSAGLFLLLFCDSVLFSSHSPAHSSSLRCLSVNLGFGCVPQTVRLLRIPTEPVPEEEEKGDTHCCRMGFFLVYPFFCCFMRHASFSCGGGSFEGLC